MTPVCIIKYLLFTLLIYVAISNPTCGQGCICIDNTTCTYCEPNNYPHPSSYQVLISGLTPCANTATVGG